MSMSNFEEIKMNELIDGDIQKRKIEIKITTQNAYNLMRECALNTINKKHIDKEINKNILRKYFKSEHSPIRVIQIYIKMYDISYYTSVHFTRHSKFQEHFVTTSRPDRIGQERNINKKVNHIMIVNPQSLIDMCRKRLCFKSAEDTRLWVETIKICMKNSDNLILQALSEFLVEDCKYRGRCNEFTSCLRNSE